MSFCGRLLPLATSAPKSRSLNERKVELKFRTFPKKGAHLIGEYIHVTFAKNVNCFLRLIVIMETGDHDAKLKRHNKTDAFLKFGIFYC